MGYFKTYTVYVHTYCSLYDLKKKLSLLLFLIPNLINVINLINSVDTTTQGL